MHKSSLLPVSLVAALALAACGGDDDAGPAETSPSSAPIATTPPSEPAPTSSAPATTIVTTAAPATEPAPTTTEQTPSTTDAAPATTEPAPSTTDAAPGEPDTVADAIVVSLPGATQLANASAAAVVTALQEFNGESGDVAAQLASYGLDIVPHVLIEEAAVFEFAGRIDATFVNREPDYSLDLSYLVQFDDAEPDPETVLAAVADAIDQLGDYDRTTSTRTSDDVTVHSLDMRGAEFADGLPRWGLAAVDLGTADEDWAGVVQLVIETYGSTPDFALPDGLADFDAQARAEAPDELTPYLFRIDDGINVFDGRPNSTRRIEYLVEGATDFTTAFADYSATLDETYGEPHLDEESEYANWVARPLEWMLRVDFEDRVVVTFQQTVFG